MKPPILVAKNINKHYQFNLKRKTILTDVSFSVETGKVLSLIGLNGAGKTTLLKILAGINRPNRGTVTINNISAINPHARTILGYMPENPQFYPNLTGKDFMITVGQLFNQTKTEAAKNANKLLHDIGLQSAGHQLIRTYSKGMRQRLGFAQAIIGDPKLLLLDEPLDGLDPLGRFYLKEKLIDLKTKGVTIIISSHILSDLASFSDDIGVIHRGRLIALASTKKFTGQHSLESAFVKLIQK